MFAGPGLGGQGGGDGPRGVEKKREERARHGESRTASRTSFEDLSSEETRKMKIAGRSTMNMSELDQAVGKK
jgi:hypothetical protein